MGSNGKNGRGAKLVKALGWFSIGLGAAELLMPRQILKISGAHGVDPNLVRSFGVREIGCGIAILATGDPLGAVMARVGGDALDLVTLGKGFASRRSEKGKLVVATANVAAVTALDVVCLKQLRGALN